MKRHVSIALAVALVLCVTATYQVDHCGAGPVETVVVSRTPNYYNFVGFSDSTRAGDVGLRAMNKACEDKYGQGARMCTSEEIKKSWKNPFSIIVTHGPAWVNPSNITMFQDVEPSSPCRGAIDGASGYAIRVAADSQGWNPEDMLHCVGWTVKSSTCTGLVFNSGTMSFGSTWCNLQTLVACCKW